jgi:membrane protease YdiL (CAAX protease family)
MPVLPYLAVALGLFWFRNAWVGLLAFHVSIGVALGLIQPKLSLKTLLKSNDVRWILLSILLSAVGGIFLHFFWSSLGVTRDFSAYMQSIGLHSANWPAFIAYFTLVNPFVEEFFWRGVLGSPTRSPYISDFLYAGFHALILVGKMPAASIIFGLTVLVLAGWFWRQLAREDQGLLAPVLGHMAADFTILMAVYRMAV